MAVAKEIKGLKCPRCEQPATVIKITVTGAASIDGKDRQKIDRIELRMKSRLDERLPVAVYGAALKADILSDVREVVEANIRLQPQRPKLVAVHSDEVNTTGATTDSIVTHGSAAHVRRLKTALGESCSRPACSTWLITNAKSTGFALDRIEQAVANL